MRGGMGRGEIRVPEVEGKQLSTGLSAGMSGVKGAIATADLPKGRAHLTAAHDTRGGRTHPISSRRTTGSLLLLLAPGPC